MALIKWLRNGLILGLTLGVTSLVSGCAWYNGLDWTYQERERGIPKRTSRQDPELQRFYELQQRIDELEARLENKEAALIAPRNPGLSGNAQEQGFKARATAAESALAYVKQKTRSAIALIDNLLAQMEPAEQVEKAHEPQSIAQPEAKTPEPMVLARADDAAIAGTLERDDQGEVVRSTSDGNRYNYTVVYVYPETQPWFDMWALLDENGVQDKWRGQNTEKQTYFIYVGAYYTESPAQKRSDRLLSLTGARPDIKVRQGYQSVAMQ